MTQGGDAVPGVQYLPVDQTLTFAAGETSKTVVIPILDDGVFGADRSVYVVLRDPVTGAALGTNAAVPLIIRNTDLPALVRLTGVRTVADSAQESDQIGRQLQRRTSIRPEAAHVTTYRLATAGKGGSFDAKKGVKMIKLRSAVYDAASHSVTLTLAKPLN